MSRTKVRTDQRSRPHTFSLNARRLALIYAMAEALEMPRSRALSELLDIAEDHVSAAVRRRAAALRTELALAAREEPRVEAPAARPRCPSCGDEDLFVVLPNGRWRCDLCMAASD